MGQANKDHRTVSTEVWDTTTIELSEDNERDDLPMCKLSEFEILLLEKPEICCEDFDALLGDFVENELPEILENKVRAHLESCPDCEEGLELYQQVIDIAGFIGKTAQAEPIPSSVKRRLHAKLNESLGLKLSVSP